jgi:chromosome segregation ATPase
MHYLAITLFEIGQFLRIVLWIAIPMVMLAILVNVYVHHRKRSRQKGARGPAVIVLEQDGFPEVLAKLHPTAEELEKEGETVYQGLLWMKNKYEQDRELADEKYGRLKASSEDRLAEKNLQIGFLQSQLDQRIKSYHELEYQWRENISRLEELQGQHAQALQLLDERQTAISRFQEQLQQGARRSEALTGRLESGNRLLLKIRQEIDLLPGEEFLPEEYSRESQLEPVA